MALPAVLESPKSNGERVDERGTDKKLRRSPKSAFARACSDPAENAFSSIASPGDISFRSDSFYRAKGIYEARNKNEARGCISNSRLARSGSISRKGRSFVVSSAEIAWTTVFSITEKGHGREIAIRALLAAHTLSHAYVRGGTRGAKEVASVNFWGKSAQDWRF